MPRGPQTMPIINNFAHSWGNVVLTINGIVIKDILSVNYQETQTIDNLYGYGRLPISKGAGNVEFQGSISVRMSEVLKLQAAARQAGSSTGSILDLDGISIIVSYIPSENGQFVVVDELQFVNFTQNIRGMNQGDTSIIVELPISIGNINWGASAI
jgi:hypothetical protein